jgi:hypothetical protein
MNDKNKKKPKKKSDLNILAHKIAQEATREKSDKKNSEKKD